MSSSTDDAGCARPARRPRSPEVRSRLSEAMRRRWADPAQRAAMLDASLKARSAPEVRARMSETQRRTWADPALRARMSEAQRRARIARQGWEVPSWVVAAGLEEDFREVAALHGEEAAASHCRALKRAAAR